MMNNRTSSQRAKSVARYWNRAEYYTLHQADIRKQQFWFHGPQFIRDVVGDIGPNDAGRRIYERNGVLYAEDKEQFKKRIAEEMSNNV